MAKIKTPKLVFNVEKLAYRDLNTITEIIIHHTAGPKNQTIFDIHEGHLANGWAGVGYHYLIDPGGTIYKGRKNSMIGSHCVGHNTKSIGIALIGNFQEEKPSSAQIVSLIELIRNLRHSYPKIKSVNGHCDFDATACPGKFLIYELQHLKILNS